MWGTDVNNSPKWGKFQFFDEPAIKKIEMFIILSKRSKPNTLFPLSAVDKPCIFLFSLLPGEILVMFWFNSVKQGNVQVFNCSTAVVVVTLQIRLLPQPKKSYSWIKWQMCTDWQTWREPLTGFYFWDLVQCPHLESADKAKVCLHNRACDGG